MIPGENLFEHYLPEKGGYLKPEIFFPDVFLWEVKVMRR
jgi:hypothetical protein